MITGSFQYHCPDSLAAVTALLAEHGDDARVLAGGHSLIPMMKLRMAAPEHLIDLKGISALRDISVGGDAVVLGAMVTQNDLLQNEELATALPILREIRVKLA